MKMAMAYADTRAGDRKIILPPGWMRALSSGVDGHRRRCRSAAESRSDAKTIAYITRYHPGVGENLRIKWNLIEVSRAFVAATLFQNETIHDGNTQSFATDGQDEGPLDEKKRFGRGAGSLAGAPPYST